jgi:copper chaperone CopZ
MKTHKIITTMLALMALVVATTGTLYGQKADKKTETVEIKSSVVCGMCEERVKKDLAFEKGVKDVAVNLETKVISVTYRTDKTDKEKIKKAITNIGYDADEMMANETAYEKLPAGCKKDAPPH